MIIMLDPHYTPEVLGFLPDFIDEDDPRPAREQFDANYQHGGGWRPMHKFKFDPKDCRLQYPGDPAMYPHAVMRLRQETILFYPLAFVLIVQPDLSFEVARMD